MSDNEFQRLDSKVELRHELYMQMFSEAKEAILKATVSLEKRLDTLNEIRGALSDKAADSITRKEVDAALKSLSEKSSAETIALRAELLPQIQKQGSRGDWYDGRGSVSMLWLAIIGAVITTTALVADILSRLMVARK